MRALAGITLITLLCALTPPASAYAAAPTCAVVAGRADQRCTPGATNPDVTQATIATTVCAPGWAATIRPPVSYTNALKRTQMVLYGETGPASSYREDHLIPLEGGGAPRDPANLFPQPVAASIIKDRAERVMRNDICSGRLTLEAAQARILATWSYSIRNHQR